MSSKRQFSISQRIKGILQLLIFIVISFGAIYLIEMYTLGNLEEEASRVIFENIYLVRTTMIFILATLVIVGFLKINPFNKTQKLTSRLSQPSVDWSSISFSRNSRQYAIGLILFFSFLYLYVFFDDPNLFRDISSDRKMVENLSALFSFLACLIFMISGFSLRRNKLEFSRLYQTLAYFFSLLFFIITMEEISWMQGIFSFKTPELFKGNSQGEMNIHNYATHQFELAYYFSTFLFFIIVPFFNDKKYSFDQIPVVSFFIPSRLMIYLGAMMSAYHSYDMWNDLFFQFTFWITILILVYYAWMNRMDNHQILLTILILIYIVSQFSFLLFGHQITRQPVFNEYREFFIPLTFFFYSLEVFLRTKRINQ